MNKNAPSTLLPCLADYVQHYAETTPEHEAIVTGYHRITYSELHLRVQAWARALLAMGIEKGDRVAMLANPCTEFVVVFLATTQIGAIWMGINPKYQLDECRYVIGDAEPKCLFSIAEFEGRDYRPLVATLQEEYPCIQQVIAFQDFMPNTLSFGTFLAAADKSDIEALYQERIAELDRFDPALLVYTSGTSGKPKGALLSHHGLCYGAETQNQHFKVARPSTPCYFPINHVAGVADTCCVCLVAGGTMHLQARFDVKQVLKTITEERITLIGAMPTMLLMMLDHAAFKETDFSDVELIWWGGAAMSGPTIKRLQALGPRLMNAYGSTESSFNVTFTEEGAELEALRDSIGFPSTKVQCRIADERGVPCEPFEQGELQLKGNYLFLGYYNQPEATAEAFTESGWFHTGDTGFWREDGSITLVGRMSEMFKSGGYNVYPREIEILLESHPDVEAAAVVSVPDPLYQEVGAAFILPSRTSANGGAAVDISELKRFCKEHLANYKVPKSFTLSEQLPTLASGKVNKIELKALTTSAV